MDKNLESFENNSEPQNFGENGEQMESKNETMQTHRGRNLFITGLIALTLATASCHTPTREDVARDREEIEVVSKQLSHMIEARKPYVRKYNELLARCEADPDNFAQERYASQVHRTIVEYNEEIEKLASKQLKKNRKLDEDILKSQGNIAASGRSVTDENYYDFLLNY